MPKASLSRVSLIRYRIKWKLGSRAPARRRIGRPQPPPGITKQHRRLNSAIDAGTKWRPTPDEAPDATPRHAWSSARLYAWLEKCPKLVAAAKTASEPASGRDLMGDHPQFRLSAWFFVAGYGGLRRSKNGSAAIRRIRNFRCTERLR